VGNSGNYHRHSSVFEVEEHEYPTSVPTRWPVYLRHHVRIWLKVGEDFFPGNYDASITDRVRAASDADSFLTARRAYDDRRNFDRRVIGMALHAALTLGAELSDDDVVVALLPGSGRGYVGPKFYNDSWMY